MPPKKPAKPERKTPVKTTRATPRKRPVKTAATSVAAKAPAAPVVPDLRPAPPPVLGSLPWGYADNRITAMARDPHWAFAYWEITDEAIAAARAKINDPHAGCALRVYETTGKLFDGLNANLHWDLGVDRGTNQYYIRTGRPSCTFHIDIGVLSHSGAFAPVARSGAVEMPRDAISPDTHASWSTVLRSGPGYSYRHRYVPKPGGPPPPPPPPGAPAADPAELDRVFQHLAGEGWSRSEWIETLMDSRVVRWIRWTGPYLPERFPLAPAGTYRHVEVLFQGERRVVRFEQGERFVFGPWRITLEAVGPKGERKTIHHWMVRHRWTTEEGMARVESPAILMRILGGQRFTMQQSGSEQRLAEEVWGSEALQRGASEWLWRGASETLLQGSSETQFVGSTETLFMGATEIHGQGASEQRWMGASELHLLGGSEIVWGLGASEHVPGSPGGDRP